MTRLLKRPDMISWILNSSIGRDISIAMGASSSSAPPSPPPLPADMPPSRDAHDCTPSASQVCSHFPLFYLILTL